MTAEELHQKIYMKGVVADWARITKEQLSKSIDKKKIGQTGALRESVKSSVAAAAGRAKFQFNYYGKFVDMGVGKGVKIADRAKAEKKSYSSPKTGKTKTWTSRHPKKWYSKTMQHQLYRLTELLASQVGRDAAEFVKQNIQLPVIIEL